MSALRVGVVGVGYLGRFHAQKFAALDAVELVGVFDINAGAAAAVARETGTAAFEDLDSLADRIEAVSIATSTSSHYELARFFLERGIHIFVEKPMTRTSVEAAELVELAAKQALKLQVGHIERFNPALLAARSELVNARFIECHRLAEFKPRSVDVDVVLDLMIHDLDVILSLVAAKPLQVSAVGIPVLTDKTDIANARIEFDNGAVANVTASRVSTSGQRKFRVFQSNQYISIDFDARKIQRVISSGDWRAESPFRIDEWSLDKGDALAAELTAFVDAVRNGTPCIVSANSGDALTSARVANGAFALPPK